MKTAEALHKNSAATNHIQKKQEPFFKKEGQGDFFAKSNDNLDSFFDSNTIQTKLTIGQPNDKYEVEADTVADKVVQRLAHPNVKAAEQTAVSETILNGENQIEKRGNNILQQKPIFESKIEQSDVELQTKLSPPLIQKKCNQCEEKEKLQKKEDQGIEEEGLEIQQQPIFEHKAEQSKVTRQAELQQLNKGKENNISTTQNTSTDIQTKSLINTSVTEEKFQKKEEELLETNEEIQDKLSETEVPLPPDDESVQTKSNDSVPKVSSNLQSRLNLSKGGGSAMGSEIKTSMGSAFGTDFNDVKIHTGSEAVQMSDELGAQAFTHGNDIYFNEGKYNINSTSGKHLLAHELTHTVQQRSAPHAIQKSDDEFIEQEFTEENLLAYTCVGLKRILTSIVKNSFITLFSVEDDSQDFFTVFMEQFSELLNNYTNLDLSEEDISTIEGRAWELSQIEATFNELTYSYPTAVLWLKDYLGLPPEVAEVGGRLSYGNQFFINTISADITYYLLNPFDGRFQESESYVYCPVLTLADLQTFFSGYVQSWTTHDGFIELEFIGALEGLIALRDAFSDPRLTEDERVAIGTEISRVSRYILLLDQELEPLRDTLEAGEERLEAEGASELEFFLDSNADRIDAIESNAATETNTLASLGNGIELLQNESIDQLDNSQYPIFNDGLEVSPDAAFPETTDETTLDMMRDLSDRIDSQSEALESLREEVIPSNPSYNFDEFIQMYDQWFAFFSPAARDSDPFYRQMDTLITGLYGYMGYAGVEGGIGRAFLMEQFANSVAGNLGGANGSFASTIGSNRPHRRESLTGTAENVDYQFGEFFGNTNSSSSFSGEQQSAERTLSRETVESEEGFNELRRMREARASRSEIEGEAIERGVMVSGRGGPIYLLPEERHQNLFSYLMTTTVLNLNGEYVPVNEQRVMPENVAEYLLAQTQHYNTLQEAHTPGVGDGTTRFRGVEFGEAGSTNRYLEGGTGSNTSINEATELRNNMSDSRSDANLPDSGSVQQIAVSRLLNDLEEYLNEYFVQNEEIVPRVLAILRISVLEHRGDEQFMQHFTAEALAKALAMSISIAGIVAALRFVPYIGFALSATIGKILKRYGIATDVGSVIAIAAFLRKSSEAGSFHSARVWGYIAKFMLSEIGQLLQGFAVSSVMDTFQVARSVVRNRQHTSVNEVMRDLEPLTKEPELKEILREDLESLREEVILDGGGNESNPKLELIDDVLLRLNSNQPDRLITPDIDGLRPGEGDSIIRADGTVSIAGETHGLSVTYRDGRLIIRICSDCDGFIGALDHAIGIAQQRGHSEAESLLVSLKEDTVNLQRRINREEINIEDATPDLNALKERLRTLASNHTEVDQVMHEAMGLNRDAVDMSASSTALEPLSGGRMISESSRLVENASGEIIQIDEAAIPSGVRPGETFDINGESYIYYGDAQQRMLVEEGFSGRDIDALGGRARVMESHDMGVEQGRLKADADGLSLIDLNPPDQYLGLFGRGVDDFARRGNVFYILEYKGGSAELGQTRTGGEQMSDRWIGTKLAEITFHYRDANGDLAILPMVNQLLRAAHGGRLRGKVYTTRWNDTRTGPLPTETVDIRYNRDAVQSAFDTRLQRLREQNGLL